MSSLPTRRANQLLITDAILSAVEVWTEMLDRRKVHSIPVAFLDMSKTFDWMDKSKLLRILANRAVNNLIRIVYGFLSDRTQCVHLSVTKSSYLPTQNGTPQGSALGPMFWFTYIDTLSTSTHTIKYADGLMLTSTNPAAADLQTLIDETTEWCTDYNVLASTKKYATLSISISISKVCHSPYIRHI